MENWWGYLHKSGTIQVKRYFEERDLEEARQSPFVERVIGPFPAFHREDALETMRDHILPPPDFLK